MASTKLLTLKEVNSLPPEDFRLLFCNIIEHSPDAAIQIEVQRPFSSVKEFRKSFYNYLDNLDNHGKELVLRKHPDLVGKVCKNQLTIESRNEQESADIDSINSENRRRFEYLHKTYEMKFSFPFIICVRENTAASIITAIGIRLQNDRMTELHNAIDEVKKICRLRLNDRVL